MAFRFNGSGLNDWKARGKLLSLLQGVKWFSGFFDVDRFCFSLAGANDFLETAIDLLRCGKNLLGGGLNLLRKKLVDGDGKCLHFDPDAPYHPCNGSVG